MKVDINLDMALKVTVLETIIVLVLELIIIVLEAVLVLELVMVIMDPTVPNPIMD